MWTGRVNVWSRNRRWVDREEGSGAEVPSPGNGVRGVIPRNFFITDVCTRVLVPILRLIHFVSHTFYISFCELCILDHSAVLYLLFVKSFIVAYDGQLQTTLIILWTSHFLFFKSWLKFNYIWALGWATAPLTPVLDTPLNVMPHWASGRVDKVKGSRTVTCERIYWTGC